MPEITAPVERLRIRTMPKALSDALAAVRKVLGKRNTAVTVAPVNESAFALRMTSPANVAIEWLVAGESAGESVTIDSERLAGLLSVAPQSPMTLTAIGNEVGVSWSGASFRLTAQSDDHHKISLPLGKFHQVDPAVLCGLIERTAFTCSKDDSRPYLAAVYLQASGDNIHARATNGAAFASVTAQVFHAIGEWDAIVPDSAARTVLRLAKKERRPISILRDGEWLHLRFSDASIAIHLIDREYPDLLRLVPSEYPNTSVVEAGPLISAISRLGLCSFDRRVKLSVGSDSLCVEAKRDGEQVGHETVRTFGANGSCEASFNADFLIDGLKHAGSPVVEVQLSGPRTPARIIGAGGYQYVVLPLIDF